MTDKQFKRRQAKIRARRKKQLMNRLMLGGGVLVIIIVILIAVIIPGRKSGPSEAELAAQAKAEAALAAKEAEETPEPTKGPMSQDEKVAYFNTYVPSSDRSDFAVDPSIPCGLDYVEGEKVVYLTLDDGPSYLTEQFLDLLDKYNVKATFFVTAQSPEYFYLIKEAYDRGHTIGLHTYSHDYATVYTSVDAYFDDLNKIGQIVKEQIGYVPCFIRFPGGSCNYISHDYCEGIMTTLSQEVQARGYQYFDWNCSSGDGGSCDNPDELAAAAMSSEWDTTVLLSHDAGGKESTLEMLPKVIEYYLSQGYEFRPITRTAYPSHQEIFN